MEKNPGSVFLPVKMNDGTAVGESLATMEQFSSLENYIRCLMRDNANCLKKGNIDINPFTIGKDSCEYCDNYPICRYEGSTRKYNTVDDTAQAWAKINEVEG
jgi:ATP-dependent helicase/DNAse subunit B